MLVCIISKNNDVSVVTKNSFAVFLAIVIASQTTIDTNEDLTSCTSAASCQNLPYP
nr:MAG TPA: hypothetical protein [Caudoviricetes sp.]